MTSNIVKYVHNNKIMEVSNFDPNETLLKYIREKLNKTGTKEGCSEGGCGACTVVIGILKNNKVEYQAINSCITFLPILHGKQLILVEDLLSKKGKLHHVQEAMVNHHGSQCGFCTPGFIMSLFSMFKNNFSYDEKTIKNSIAGNLCRCTGYATIIKAGKSLNGKSKTDKFTEDLNENIKLLKLIKKEKKSLNILSNNKKFFAPKKIAELKKIIKENPNSTLLNGGTDLSLLVTKEQKELNSIIYLGDLDELIYIEKKKNFFEIGSSTPLIYFEKYIKKYYPDIANILKRYGSIQIKNLATIAGNLGTASPIGDTLPILLSLNAIINIGSFNNQRSLPINDYFTGYRKTKLKKGEFIKSIQIPVPNNNIFKAYKISKRFDDDISSVCAAFNLSLEKNKIKKINIAFGGMAEIPKRARLCENSLLNKELSEKNFKIAQKFIEKDFNPINDMRASSIYRIEIAKNLIFKFLIEIKEKKLLRLNV
tara:strand:- start:727 stop:2172 length:1446 start_codon:yes stop_codon:yes gene_type:complete